MIIIIAGAGNHGFFNLPGQ